jgi:hypothetical protein
LIGNDLEPAALADVRNHLGECVDCRQHLERLSSCLEVLQAPHRTDNVAQESLWPKLSVRLASPNAGQKPHRLNGWAPTLAVAAACMAMLWFTSTHWMARQAVNQPGMPNGVELQPIADPPALEPDGSPARNRTDSRLRNPVRNPSQEESRIIPFRGQRPDAIPVVPVGEPAH